MSDKTHNDIAEIELERVENKPKLKEIAKATVLAKNNKGIYLDLGKAYEAYVSKNELGSADFESFAAGQQIEIMVLEEDKNQSGVFRASIKKIEDQKKWHILEGFRGKNLELEISKVLKSGIEVKIEATEQIGFIPHGYIDIRQSLLKARPKENWVGLKIPGRIHELEQSRNKIILNNKVIAEEMREAKAAEIIKSISIGQTIEGEVVRIADFGIFADIGGIDALIPSSELSWRRFKKPSDIINIGEKIKAKIFKIESEQKRIAMSIKQTQPDPWTVLPEEIQIGALVEATVVTHADFGVFVEIIPGIEALYHRSNFINEEPLEIGTSHQFEIVNLEASKKRMGIKLIESTTETTDTAEPELPTQEESLSEEAEKIIQTLEEHKAKDSGEPSETPESKELA